MAVSRSWTPLKPSEISWRNWWSGEPSRVGSSRSARREASPSKYVPSRSPDAADGGVPLGLVEQLVDELLEGSAVPEEALERAGQPPVPVREVGAEDVLHRARRLLVDGARLGDQLLELPPDHVHVHRRRRVLEGQEADAQGALHDRRPLGRVTLGERRSERSVREHETLDDDAVSVDADRRRPGCGPCGLRCRTGQGEESGFHGPILAGARAT